MQTIEPSWGYLLAKPSSKQTQTATGFLLSEKSAEAPKLAEVIAVGPDVKNYQPGDQIIYKPYAMTEVNLNDAEHYLIEQQDVLGKLKND